MQRHPNSTYSFSHNLTVFYGQNSSYLDITSPWIWVFKHILGYNTQYSCNSKYVITAKFMVI